MLPHTMLDVFTDRPFHGNPLAVVKEADALSPAQMQRIAREFNLSETIFVMAARQPGHTARVRIFFPTAEIPFAGHPTLSCALHLARRDRHERVIPEEEAGPGAGHSPRRPGRAARPAPWRRRRLACAKTRLVRRPPQPIAAARPFCSSRSPIRARLPAHSPVRRNGWRCWRQRGRMWRAPGSIPGRGRSCARACFLHRRHPRGSGHRIGGGAAGQPASRSGRAA